MKRLLVLSFLLIALVSAGQAEATTFTLSSYHVSLRQSDPGLVLWEKDLLPEPSTFDLNGIGDSHSTTLFKVGTKETALNLDDLVPYSIAVTFNFSSPALFGGNMYGITGAAWLGRSFGYVLWDNPLLLAFGNGGLLQVTLSNAVFGLPGAAEISANFVLTNGHSVPVPEPASALLIGLGLAAGATALRRRRHA